MTYLSRSTHSAKTLFLASLCALLGPTLTQAQSSARGTFLAVPEAFPQIDARAIVVRERGRDVVVLRAAEATPDALAMSLLVLERARERDPDPRLGEMIPITGFVFTTELGAHDRARLERVLRRLRDRPLAEVGSFGPGRWIRYGSR